MERVKERLIQAGVKPSLQRMAVMQYLMEHRTHPTVDEIFLSLSPSIPTLSKTTIYNTLKLLVKEGVVLMLTIDESYTRYDADISDHSHFICSSCGKVYDIKSPEIGKLSLDPGFVTTQRHLYVKGICSNCNKTN